MSPLPPRKPALLIIDMQQDFCFPHSALPVPGARQLAPLINSLLSLPGFVCKIASRDFHPQGHVSFASTHPGAEAYVSTHTIANPENGEETQTTLLWPDHCVQNTPGSELIPELDSAKLTHTILKGADPRVESYSAFGPPFRQPKVAMTELDDILGGTGVTDVFIVGVAYDFCVKHTALDAVELGYRTFLVEDGVKGAREEAVEGCREELERAGVEIVRSDGVELDVAR